MSTTVTYRGDTIASMGNTGTKTLKTAGKYLDDDITITANVPSGSVNIPTVMIDPDISLSVDSDGQVTAEVSETVTPHPEVTNGYITGADVSVGPFAVAGSHIMQLSTQAGKTVAPTESVQTAVASGKYTTGAVKVGAISSTYIGSGVPQKSSSDLTVSGATVTAPAGYYASSASKSVSSMTLPTTTASSATSGYTSKATISRSTSDQYINIPTGYNTSGAYYKVSAVPNGSAGTPTATKGTVSNNSISITPSVTNTTGYITGSTKTGTAVTVSASELVSGTKTISAAGTTDVTNYASASIPTGAVSIAARSEDISNDISISVGSDGLINASVLYGFQPAAGVTNGFVKSSNVSVGFMSASGNTTHQLTTQAKMVAHPDNTGDILAGRSTQYTYTFRAEELVQGQWSLNVPADTPLTRARTKDFIYVSAGDTITYTNNSYDSYFQVYGSKTSSTISQNIGWKTDSGGTINITVNGYLTFVTRNHYNTSANVNPALWDGAVTITHTTVHNGVNFTWSGTDSVTFSGTCNTSGAVCQMIERASLPSSVIPGETYYVTCTSSPAQANARLRIVFHDSNGDSISFLYFSADGFFTVPSGAVTWIVQLHSMPSVSYSPAVTLSNMHIYPAKKIVDAGVYTTGDIYVSGYSTLVAKPANYVEGTFTGTTSGSVLDIDIPYTGSGFPVSISVAPVEGPANSTTGSFYNLISYHAISFFYAMAYTTNVTPDYSTGGNALIAVRYKNSTTSATDYSNALGGSTFYTTSSPSGSNASYTMRMKSNTKLSVFIKSDAFGFAPNIQYTYRIAYSS